LGEDEKEKGLVADVVDEASKAAGKHLPKLLWEGAKASAPWLVPAVVAALSTGVALLTDCFVRNQRWQCC